jgi:hypothetical protein
VVFIDTETMKKDNRIATPSFEINPSAIAHIHPALCQA